jgi:divalent metal cation (Fe/Co/Zn/Cd) transporter
MSLAHADQVTGAAQVRYVLKCILVANLAVVAAELVIGVCTGSLTVFGDAIHSSVDSINNLLALVLVSFPAHRMADAVEDELRSRFDSYDITVHVEPC